MAEQRRGTRAGPVERAAAAVPPPAGRAFRFVVLVLLATSTGGLVTVAALLWAILGRMPAAEPAPLGPDVTAVKGEVASFHADVAKGMAALQKTAGETANEVNAITLKLNDIALGLHKGP